MSFMIQTINHIELNLIHIFFLKLVFSLQNICLFLFDIKKTLKRVRTPDPRQSSYAYGGMLDAKNVNRSQFARVSKIKTTFYDQSHLGIKHPLHDTQ